MYVFGSACHHDRPNDLDMLFVYDSTVVPCDAAYAAFEPLIQLVEDKVGIRVHSVVLSVDEARNSGFVEQVAAIELRSTGGDDVPVYSGRRIR